MLSSYEQKLLLSILSNTNSIQRNALLAAMNMVTHESSVLICKEILKYSQNLNTSVSSKKGMNSTFLDELLHRWVLLICSCVLQPISSKSKLSLYFSGGISEYRFWLIIDAIYSRSILLETLDDHAGARECLIQLLRDIMSASELNEHTISNIPIPVINLCSLASCRLPILEYKLNMMDACVKSLGRCIADDHAFKRFIPLPIYIGKSSDLIVCVVFNWCLGILVEFCLMRMINRHAVLPSEKQKQGKSSTSDMATQPVTFINISEIKLDALISVNNNIPLHSQWEDELRNVYNILLNAKAYKTFLLEKDQTPSGKQFTDKLIAKMPNSVADLYVKSSLMIHLNSVPCDPCKFAKNSQGLVIGTLLTAFKIKFYPYLGIYCYGMMCFRSNY